MSETKSPAKKTAAKKTAAADTTVTAAAAETPPIPAPVRLDVRKTYKLYIGGAFPRSESGRDRKSVV